MKKNNLIIAALFITACSMFLAALISTATEEKCFKSGCNQPRYAGSSYCYSHRPKTTYRKSGSSSIYSSKSSSSGSSTSSSKAKSSSSSSSSSKSSSSGTSRKSSSSSSKSYRSYDDGYDDVYDNEDYDWDRYRSDSDYASGVDDAMDELDW